MAACRSAEVRTLCEEIRNAEDAMTSATAKMLNRVVDERERRLTAEAERRRVSTPLALQEESNRMKEALQLEVIARQAAEAKAQRLHRQHAALDSQLRLASETAARLQREHRISSGDRRASGATACATDATPPSMPRVEPRGDSILPLEE
jgi:phage-related tail protein